MLLPPLYEPSRSAIPTLGEVTAEAMLRELRSRGLGVAAPWLVQALSDLRLWMRHVESVPDVRPGATFGSRSLTELMHLPGLREALTGLAVGLSAGGVCAGTVTELARDCADVAAWLEGRGALCSAAGYAEAAAVLDPESPRRMLLVARLARELRWLPEAVTWGTYALRLAGRTRDPAARAAVLVELAHLSATRQRYAEARRLFTLARRFAESRGISREKGDAIAGLAMLQWGHRREAEALELFAEAARAYGAGTRDVADLGQLVVRLWLDAGEYRGAALLGRVLLTPATDPHFAVPVAGMLARAAAALGWELIYESACQCALLALGQLPPDGWRAAPLLDLTQAHVGRGFWARAELTADLARLHARATGDTEAARRAKRMLAAAARRKLSKRLRSDLFPDRARECPPEDEEYTSDHPVQALVTCFQAALDCSCTRLPGV